VHTMTGLTSGNSLQASSDRIDQKYVDQLVQLFHRFFRTAVPDVLWHYTSLESAEKIICGDSLFFSHVSELNDTTEVEYAANLSRRQLEKWLSNEALDLGQKALLEAAKSSLLEKNRDSSWYTFSLSDVRDDLSQWRAYGNSCAGVSIGFDSRKLIRFLSNSTTSRPMVLPVCYDEETVCQFGDAIIALTLENFASDFGGSTFRIENFLSVWGRHVDAFSVLPKKLHFSSEREWRFAIQPNPIQIAVSQAKLAKEGRLLVGKGHASDFGGIELPIVEILEGPLAGIGASEQLKQAFDEKKEKQPILSKSIIPLRS
jgi:hypothetical protein